MKIWKIFPLVIVLVGCASSPSTQSSVLSMTQAPSLSPTLYPTQTISATPTQTTTPPFVSLSNGSFTLTIYSPVDQAILSEPQVEINGEVSENAVLTINNETYLLPPGAFTLPVALEEGPNAIQIVASDMNGNEIDLVLTVIYQP